MVRPGDIDKLARRQARRRARAEQRAKWRAVLDKKSTKAIGAVTLIVVVLRVIAFLVSLWG